jgi:uncharacterized phage-associated protein
MSSVPVQFSPPAGLTAEPLSQLMPFNEERFRECMAYLAHVKAQSLSQLYLVKFSLLIDLFHVLRCGKPVIGGSLAPWELGPVVQEAYRVCVDWRTDYDRYGRNPVGFKVVALGSGGKLKLKAAGEVDLDNFSAYEIESMECAWEEIGHLNIPSLRHYTHSPDTFLGFAYSSAKAANRLMDWYEIIDAYDRFRGENHSAIKALIQF